MEKMRLIPSENMLTAHHHGMKSSWMNWKVETNGTIVRGRSLKRGRVLKDSMFLLLPFWPHQLMWCLCQIKTMMMMTTTPLMMTLSLHHIKRGNSSARWSLLMVNEEQDNVEHTSPSLRYLRRNQKKKEPLISKANLIMSLYVQKSQYECESHEMNSFL